MLVVRAQRKKKKGGDRYNERERIQKKMSVVSYWDNLTDLMTFVLTPLISPP